MLKAFGLALSVACGTLTFAAGVESRGEVKRGRNEGSLTIPASNVMGNGNITAFLATTAGYVTSEGFGIEPVVGGRIGIGGILQFAGSVVPIGAKGLGPLEAHLQATIPGNDRLRLLGIAAIADLYLSTAQDTISRTADTSKPDYTPHLLPSLVVDLDWLARFEHLPLKSYVKVSAADNPQLLYRYRQLGVLGGCEWKMYKHGIFLEAGTGLYREKASKLNNFKADAGFEQLHVWLRPGGRYRFAQRFSVIGGIRIPLYQRLKSRKALPVEVFDVSVRLDAPLYFRETNTEAIRTLVFMEQRKREEETEQEPVVERGAFDELGLELPGLEGSGEGFDYKDKKAELVQRRKEVQETMKEIEMLLEEIEAEED